MDRDQNGSDAWYSRGVDEVQRAFGVEVDRGLSAAEAAQRLATDGPNRLATGAKESALAAFARQYRDFMQLVLLAAAILNLIVTGADRGWPARARSSC